MDTKLPPIDDDYAPINFQHVYHRPEPTLSETIKWALADTKDVITNKINISNRSILYARNGLLSLLAATTAWGLLPSTADHCEVTPLTTLLVQGGDDAKRTETIRAVQSYLTANPDADDRDLAEAGLQFLRADAANVDADNFDSDIQQNFAIQYLGYINDMRGNRFDEALTAIRTIFQRGCTPPDNSLDTNNRRVTLARYAFQQNQDDVAYQIAEPRYTTNITTQYQLNFMAGYIQTYKNTPDHQSALTHFTAARALSNESTNIPQIEFYVGVSHHALGHYDQARVHFANATRNNATSFYGQLSAHYNGTAPQYVSPTVRLNPNDPPLAFAINNENCATRVMFGQRADTAAIPASLTKVMTLYTFAQIMARTDVDLNLDTMVRIPNIIRDKIPHDLAVIDSLTVGREVSVRDLLVMTGARSDAVSSVALAIAAGRAAGWEGSEEAVYDRFVALMNQNAGDMGMTKTKYGNPIGNSTGRGDRGNISSPVDTNILMNAFERNFPTVFELSLGQSRIDISPYSAARIPSSRTLQDNPNVIASKTGILRDRDPHYGVAAGYNQVDRVQSRDVTSMRSRFTVSVFGADSTDNREDVMVRITRHLPEIDARAFCLATDNFRYHPTQTALPFYTARRAP